MSFVPVDCQCNIIEWTAAGTVAILAVGYHNLDIDCGLMV